jgi:hypothetical protein
MLTRGREASATGARFSSSLISGSASDAASFESSGIPEGSRDCERNLLSGRGRRASGAGSEGSEGTWISQVDVVNMDVGPETDRSPV